MKSAVEELESWLARWDLTPDGAEIRTASSILLPVLRDQQPLMLKFAQHEEEERGNALMAWWDGRHAASVLEHAGPALLMERAKDPYRLQRMGDNEALEIICTTVGELHSAHVQRDPPAQLVPLDVWFQDLTGTDHLDSIMNEAADVARALLAKGAEHQILHGDIHHGNILEFGNDWRVIDPKGLIGPRGFEYANLFLNPGLAAKHRQNLPRRLGIVSSLSGFEKSELSAWIFAWCGLSSVWSAQDENVKAVKNTRKFMEAAKVQVADFSA